MLRATVIITMLNTFHNLWEVFVPFNIIVHPLRVGVLSQYNIYYHNNNSSGSGICIVIAFFVATKNDEDHNIDH